MSGDTRYRKVRPELKVECPTPKTLGCDEFKCAFDKEDCDTDCMNEQLICVMCSVQEKCENPIKKYIVDTSKMDGVKKTLLAMHDKIQDEILEIQKYWHALKLRQKWTAKDKLKDLGGQLKGIRYALHKLNVPFRPKVKTGMKIEEQMIKFWQQRDLKHGKTV